LIAILAIMAFVDLEKASVAHAKNTLSSLINKVAYGKTRVVLESRGKPKAALISAEDLEMLQRLEQHGVAPRDRLHILARAQTLRGKMRRRRKKIIPDSAERLNRLREERDHKI
jgi:prevent-host-death family protein